MGERVLASIEKACGVRLLTCPWQGLRDPFVGQVIRSYRWWKEQQLEARWGGVVPEAIARGVEVYDAALNAVQMHDLRAEQAKRDAEAEQRMAELSGPQFPRPPRIRRPINR